ncbi:MAG: hypothetical protein GC204_03715 [Chloroflexi bacterium]|nr:hypothetical protein [Chloroflexota bacterium]
MPDGPSIHDTLAREKELARERRRRQGADTTLDDAERRYEAIWDAVWARRFWGPFRYPLLLGWMAPSPGPAWVGGVVGMLLAVWVALICKQTLHFFVGRLEPEAGGRLEYGLLFVFGLGLGAIGLAAHSVGDALGGAALTLMPLTWPAWARRRMARTDYARLRAAMAQPAAPRLME